MFYTEEYVLCELYVLTKQDRLQLFWRLYVPSPTKTAPSIQCHIYIYISKRSWQLANIYMKYLAMTSDSSSYTTKNIRVEHLRRQRCQHVKLWRIIVPTLRSSSTKIVCYLAHTVPVTLVQPVTFRASLREVIRSNLGRWTLFWMRLIFLSPSIQIQRLYL
jgi:hypothetical protein